MPYGLECRLPGSFQGLTADNQVVYDLRPSCQTIKFSIVVILGDKKPQAGQSGSNQ